LFYPVAFLIFFLVLLIFFQQQQQLKCAPCMQVMFPVFQILENNIDHYFLLTLNIRNERFEVLDSMRSLEDLNLRNCCNKLIEAIKKLWSIHYQDSNKQIEDYQLVEISVPKQTNK
jgi:hypothetical protein